MVFGKVWGKRSWRPLHVGISYEGNHRYSKKNKVSLKSSYDLTFDNIFAIIKDQIDMKIPVLSFRLLKKFDESDEEFIQSIEAFFTTLACHELIFDNQVRVSIFGKWYDLPGETVERFKDALERTRDFDRFFVNFCINYDGKEEIVDAVRMIGRKIMTGTLVPDAITKDTIKENLYSQFVPPDVIIRVGSDKIDDFFLWDKTNAKVVFVDKYIPDFTSKEFNKVIKG